MSKNNNVLQDAIADAKMIRETALINAKNALEETLKPKLEKMMSRKLNEMDEFGNDELEEDVDLSSILQELEDDLNESEDDNDDKDKDKKSDKKSDDKSPSKPSKPKEKTGSEKDEDDKSDEKLSNLTVEEFTTLIQSVVSQEMSTGTEDLGGEMGDDLGMGDDLDGGMGDDLGGEMGMDNMGDDLGGGMPGSEDEDEFDIDEILRELDDMVQPSNVSNSGLNENKILKRKLNEAYKAVKVLRTEINEINLLNAKLLYVNKIFKAKNLNEGQKLKVISSFDRATNVKEVKLIFESLNSNILNPVNPNKKSTIKENLGFASKPAGMSQRKPILEVNDSLLRMQVLAGIK